VEINPGTQNGIFLPQNEKIFGGIQKVTPSPRLIRGKMGIRGIFLQEVLALQK